VRAPTASPRPPEGIAGTKLLERLAAVDAEAALPDRLAQLEAVVRWVVEVPATQRLRSPVKRQLGRLRALVAVLADQPELRARLSAALGAALRECGGVAIFAEAGMPNDRGLRHEVRDRLARRLLPRPPDHGNLERFVSRLFPHARECAWIADAPVELLVELGDQLGDVWKPVRAAMADALALLCTRISALGLNEEIRERSAPGAVRDSPFFKLPRSGLADLPGVIAACRAQLDVVHEHMEDRGVSVDVVYCVDAIRRMLARIELMLPLLASGGEPAARAAAARDLLDAVTHARLEDDSIRQLMRTNLRLLARKVIERAGDTGEHYVTATRRGWWKMVASAGGGGFLTLFTCVLKFLTKWGHFAPFIDGLLSSVNYAGSFMLMQLLGFTLATKQPSMTASTLAGGIREAKGEHRLDELVTLIARISRSQMAAAIGNILLVIPTAILFDRLWVAGTGDHFLNHANAAKVIGSFHPINGWTIPFAALTGVFLWLSSLGAGWLENWVTYRRIPDGLRAHGMHRVADFVHHNASGVGGNTSLGFLLGMTPAVGGFFGIPLDVRHVTLSTGSLTLAACSLGTGVLTSGPFLWACLGIWFILTLNFGVSFALALLVAFRAREVSQRERVSLAVAVGRRFLKSPWEFFLPIGASVE
jgi:site-specific recombinase